MRGSGKMAIDSGANDTNVFRGLARQEWFDGLRLYMLRAVWRRGDDPAAWHVISSGEVVTQKVTV
jgi:hypothetical protein